MGIRMSTPDLTDLPKGLQWEDKSGWIIDKLVWGTRIHKALGFISREKAESELNNRVQAAKNGEHIPENRIRSLTVRSALNTWYVEHLKGMKSEERKYNLTPLDRILGHIPVMKLKKRDIDRYIKLRRSERKIIRKADGIAYGKQISVNTIRHELNELKMAINHLYNNEMIPKNPLNPVWFKGKELKLPRRKKIVLDYGRDLGPQFLMIYKHISRTWHWRLFYLLLYETGMRPKEAKNLRVDWISEVVPGYYQITIPPDEEKTGNEDRRLPVSPRLAKRLIPHIKTLNPDSLIFESIKNPGNPIVDHDDQFHRALRKSGLAGMGITVYALRRTKATMWSSIDDLASRVALGHAPVDPHEESYVEVTPERLFRLIGVEINIRESLKLYRKVG